MHVIRHNNCCDQGVVLSVPCSDVPQSEPLFLECQTASLRSVSNEVRSSTHRPVREMSSRYVKVLIFHGNSLVGEPGLLFLPVRPDKKARLKGIFCGTNILVCPAGQVRQESLTD